MITGIIAAVILIAVLPPAIGNGETWVIVVAVVAAVLVLAIGAASRSSDRAYNNVTNYWAKGGPAGSGGSGAGVRKPMSPERSKEIDRMATDSVMRFTGTLVEGGYRSPSASDRKREDEYIRKTYGVEPVCKEIWLNCEACGKRTQTLAQTYVTHGELWTGARCMACRNLYKIQL